MRQNVSTHRTRPSLFKWKQLEVGRRARGRVILARDAVVEGRAVSFRWSLAALAVQSSTGDGWIGDWSPGIGDPTVMGWLTVAAYFAASWLCVRAFRRAHGGGQHL